MLLFLVLLGASAAANSWSASDTLSPASPSQNGQWQSVPGLNVTVAASDEDGSFFISYSIGLQAYSQGQNTRGLLQARLVVDGVAFRDGSTHAQAIIGRTAPVFAGSVDGYLLVRLQPNTTHFVGVQWKSSGNGVTWRSDPEIGSGFVSGRALIVTKYRKAWSHVATKAATYLLPRNGANEWIYVPDSTLHFAMEVPDHVRLAYCVTVHAEVSTNPWEAVDELLLRLVVDGTAYEESVSVFANRENRVSATRTMQRSLVLYMSVGSHTVSLEWKKSIRTSTIVFRSDPFSLDGFGSSRTLFAVADQHGVDAIEHLQAIDTHLAVKSPSQDWATVMNEKFTLFASATVIFEYALPVISKNLTSFDSWTYEQLAAVGARLLVDGTARRGGAGALLGGYTQRRSELHGVLSVELTAGSHTATLQWHAASEGGHSVWDIVAGFRGTGVAKKFSLITITEIYEQHPEIVVPLVADSLYVREDEIAHITGVHVAGLDPLLPIEFFAEAQHGYLSLEHTDVATDTGARTTASTPARRTGNETSSALAFNGATEDVNEALDSLLYVPSLNYHGDDTITVRVTAGSTNSETNFSLVVTPVNDKVTIAAPKILTVVANTTSLPLTGIDVFDPDAADTDGEMLPRYVLTVLALGGYITTTQTTEEETPALRSYFEICAPLSVVNEYFSGYSDKNLNYVPKVGFTSHQYAETITIVVTDLNVGPEHPDHRSTAQISVKVMENDESTTIILPSYWEMAIHGLDVISVDSTATYTLSIAANAELARLAVDEDIAMFGVNAEPHTFGRELHLTGVASNLSSALESMLYVREPAFDGGDTIEATLRLGHEIKSTTAIFIDINREGKSELKLVGIDPSRGPSTGGTLVTLLALNQLSSEEGSVMCQFGNIASTPASLVTVTSDAYEYTCASPANNVSQLFSNSSAFVPIRLTNQIDQWSDALYFLFEPLLLLEEIFPSFGTYGTKIQMRTSSSIIPSINLSCAISGLLADDEVYVVSAEYINSSTAVCEMPETRRFRENAGSLSIGLSTNGLDVGSNSMTFVYVPSFVEAVSMGPASGPAEGGTSIAVSGLFLISTPYLCQFCDQAGVQCCQSHGTVQNRSNMLCTTPRRLPGMSKTVRVKVSPDFGSTFALVGDFSYWSNVSIVGIVPDLGPASGGTDVQIMIEGVTSTDVDQINCAFGDTDVVVGHIHDETIRCTSPPHPEGYSNLAISFDNAAVTGRDLPLTFMYVPDIVLESLQPPLGRLTGGTSVLISGLNFPHVLDLSCRFGQVFAPALWISSTTVECFSPSHSVAESVDVAVGIGNAWFSINNLSFWYYAPIKVDKLSPHNGPTSGGTTISVLGSGFVYSPYLRCSFGWIDTPATLIHSHEIKCISPPQKVGTVSLAISLNLQQYDATTYYYTYEPPLAITALSPPLGKTSGGTLVTISMNDTRLAMAGTLTCTFGEFEGHAKSNLSSSQIQCFSPPHVTKSVPVRISTNGGVDVYSSTVMYRYTPDPLALELFPNSGSVEGNYCISVYGLNFVDSSLVRCQFGETQVPGRFVSTTHIECTVPESTVGQTIVEVSVNAVEFSSSGLLFTYLPEFKIDLISPASGPTSGGTEVRLTGSGIRFSPEYSCRFGLIAVPASYWSSEEIRCASPPRSGGTVGITLLKKGQALANFGEAFTYRKPAIILEMRPTIGFSEGGTIVRLYGKRLMLSNLACTFGNITQRAHILSSESIECLAPAYEPGAVTITVHNNMMSVGSSMELRFEFMQRTRVLSLYPRFGFVNEGTLLTIHGLNFVDTNELSCRFGNEKSSLAHYIDSNTIQCESPIGTNGRVAVEVTLNGQEFTSDRNTFTCIDISSGFNFEPAFGPTSGGTVVTVFGTNFALIPNMECVFGISHVPAMFVSASVIKCIAPFHLAAIAPLSVSINNLESRFVGNFIFQSEIAVLDLDPPLGSTRGGTAVILRVSDTLSISERSRCYFGDHAGTLMVKNGSVLCTSPPHAQQVVPVSLSLNGLDQFSNMVQYHYLVDPVVAYVSPSSGPRFGGTALLFYGQNFANIDDLRCKIGNKIVATKWISSTLLECSTPPHLPGKTAVWLTLNEQELFASPAMFEFTGDSTELELHPLSGPTSGGINVIVKGFNFTSADELRCRFQDVVADAVLLNSNSLNCILPRNEEGIVEISISTNGVDFFEAGDFYYWSDVSIQGCFSCFGSQSGGTEVILATTKLPLARLTNTTCVFEDQPAIETRVLSSGRVLCKSPTHQPGTVSLSLQFEGQVISLNDVTFEYLPDAVLESIQPRLGFTHGGAKIVVSGVNFPNVVGLSCSFGSNDVPAIWINATRVECETPRRNAGQASFVLGVNQWSTLNQLEFVYVPPFEVLRLSPSRGPTSGGTQVTVIGTNFSIASPSYCRFGWLETEAIFLNASAIRCVTPASHHSASVSVAISQSLQASLRSPLLFTYVVPLAVVSVAPALGTTLGGTLVTFTMGSPIPISVHSISCHFGVVEGRLATVVSPLQFQCVTPPHAVASVYTRISTNGLDFSSSALSYQYVRDPRAYQLSPNSGSVIGELDVRVLGLNFVDTNTLICRFGEQRVPARFVSTSEVECSAPSAAAGMVDVEISINGVDFTKSGLLFEYVTEPRIEFIKPANGPTSGGTEVRFLGSGLRFSSKLNCRFGWIDVTTSFRGSEEIMCHSPPHSEGIFETSLVESGRNYGNFFGAFQYVEPAAIHKYDPVIGNADGGTVLTFHGTSINSSKLFCHFGEIIQPAKLLSPNSLQCISPAHTIGSVEISVYDQSEILQSLFDLTFEFVRRPHVESLYPQYGRTSGGSQITILGFNFIDSKDLSCRFGKVRSSLATWIHSSKIVCESPPGLTGSVPVEVSLNNQEFTSDDVHFTFLDTSSAVEIEPSFGPMNGGTEVIIRGQQFGYDALCRFGDVNVPVNVVDGSNMSCLLPAMRPGKIDFTLFTGGHVIYQSHFEVLKLIDVEFWPLVGSRAGNTFVFIKSTSSSTLSTGLCCRFTSVGVTPVEYGETLSCLSPKATMNSRVSSLSLVLCNRTRPYIEVSTESNYVYHDPIEIFGVNPGVILPPLSKNVVVTGSNFVNSPWLSCHMFEQVVAAQWLTEATIACKTPTATGKTLVHVSNDGQIFTNFDNFAIEVIPELRIHRLEPTFVWLNPSAYINVYGAHFSTLFLDKVNRLRQQN